MPNPSISVVSPTYNSSPFIRETVASILEQTVLPDEMVFADDGSTDGTHTIIRKMMIGRAAPTLQVLSNPHRGPGAARNAAVLAATGEWIAFLDSDDRWEPIKIERIREAITTHPNANFFCHNQHHRRRDGSIELLDLASQYRSDIALPRQLFRVCLFATSAVICRRDLLLTHGLFDESLPSAQDYELWLRLAPHLRVQFVSEALGWYIERPGSISSTSRWRHFANVMRALTRNRRNTLPRWYWAGMLRHSGAFAKHRIERYFRV